jgi:anhydro-N-acetylmuramic acid kinase
VIVAGVMSGTSADGINIALVRLSGRGLSTRMQLLTHEEYPFPTAVRRKILSVMNASATVADLARLNFLLGEIYAGAILQTQQRAKVNCDLVGCHGQTIYHQGEPASFLGRRIAVTWQTGEGAVIAARCGVPVVTDFRPADMAVGGKGAPLVPFLDYMLYRHPRRGRIVQNIGGIGNLTAIPAAAKPEQVVAFDTGPGNMVMDALMERLYGRPFDRDGRVARCGTPIEKLVSEILRLPFFRRRPPRTAGREEFGREFVERFLKKCGNARKEDVVATATLLTARSIAQAVGMVSSSNTALNIPTLRSAQDGVPSKPGSGNGKRETGNAPFRDFIVSGGGANNPTLMAMLSRELEPLGLQVRRSDEFGLPSEAKEAAAFAVLAYQTSRREPGNVPSATGASAAAVLGKISFPPVR